MAEMLRRLRHFLFIWLALSLDLTGQTPQFKTGVDLVTLDITVRDKSGKPVTDFTQDEFTVLENGKPDDWHVRGRSLAGCAGVQGGIDQVRARGRG